MTFAEIAECHSIVVTVKNNTKDKSSIIENSESKFAEPLLDEIKNDGKNDFVGLI